MQWETKYTLESKRASLGVLCGYESGWTRVAPDKIQIAFASYIQLVNYLSKYNERSLWANSKIPLKSNSLLKHVISTTETGDPKVKYVLIRDSEGKNMYCMGFRQDVLNWKFNERIEAERIAAWKSQFMKSLECKRGVPVPGTGVVSRRWGRSRKSGLSNASILRDSCASEGWLRAKRASIPDWWYADDGNSRLRSWKDTTRNPKQWMRGVQNRSPKRGHGTYVDNSLVMNLQTDFELKLKRIQELNEEIWEAFDSMSA